MSVLQEIVANTREEVAQRRTATPRAALERRCAEATPALDFEGALRPSRGGVRLIAEVKKASPSRGVLAKDLDPVALASTYAAHGADAISVLTDRKYFRGSLDDLRAVRSAVDVPLLRKDFTVDEYQLWESRAAGADAILLIVSILESQALGDLLAAAKGLGLAALVECHTAAAVDRARRGRAVGAGARPGARGPRGAGGGRVRGVGGGGPGGGYGGAGRVSGWEGREAGGGRVLRAPAEPRGYGGWVVRAPREQGGY